MAKLCQSYESPLHSFPPGFAASIFYADSVGHEIRYRRLLSTPGKLVRW